MSTYNYNASCKRRGKCLSCPGKVGPRSTVRCDPCHFRKLANERGSGERKVRHNATMARKEALLNG